MIARRILQERLDLHFNGINSFVMRKQREHLEKDEAKHQRAKSRLEVKRAFKARMTQSDAAADTGNEDRETGDCPVTPAEVSSSTSVPMDKSGVPG